MDYAAHVEAYYAHHRHLCEVKMLRELHRSAGRGAVYEYLNAPEVSRRRQALINGLNAAMEAARRKPK